MRKRMLETEYRASRLCRVLGNPTAYQIAKFLLGKKKRPIEIAMELGISLPLVSITLRNLRNIDIVRYDTIRNEKVYWIKDETIFEIIRALEKFATRMRLKIW